MIGGLVEHDGHGALAIHLGKASDNEAIATRTRGLSAQTIVDAISELRLMGLGCRTKKPLLHAWASPGRSYTEADWETYWALFEAEYGLEGYPHAEVQHLKFGKGGRSSGHVHRVYLRVGVGGKANPTSHSAARQEKISRVAEHMVGERFTAGCYNKSVIARLRLEGRHDVADAMAKAGLGETNATKASTSAERAMTERLHDLAADEVWRRAADAWRCSDNGAAFGQALAETGLRLAMGEKVPVLVSPGGAVHPLLRAINKGAERQKGKPIRKADLDRRLKDMVLPFAGNIEPLPVFDAGVFSITNLDRMPLKITPQDSGVIGDGAQLAPTRPLKEPSITVEQTAALLHMVQAFHSVAANRAKATREAIEAEVLEDIDRRQKAAALQRRIDAEKAAWDLPGIGVVGSRDAYRAELAGLPKSYGAHLRWVEQLDAERRRVILRSGATVTLAPTRAWIEKQGGPDAMAIMVAHARERAWASVTITGSTQWRYDLARAVTRAGLNVADPDLVIIAQAEKIRMAQERLITTWWRHRKAYAYAPPEDRPTVAEPLIRVLERIAADPDLIDIVANNDQRRMLVAELGELERLRSTQDEPSPSGPPVPSG